jgi:dTDP-4-amino-4,6-dideoxygalactose transaminase
MSLPFNDLAPLVERYRDEIDAAINRVLKRGWFIHGPEVESFERAFGETLSLPHVIGVANGTDAIQLALMALGIGAGDEVICPALTAGPTALAILAAGAQPVFGDIDPVTLTLDPARLAECLGPAVKAILPVHLYGNPADMQAIMAFAEEHHLHVIEDCAQAHGARIDGKRVGTFGEISIFSFYPTKNLGAFGDGGAVATADPDLALRVRQLANLGQIARFDHALPGINSRLDELQAAVLEVLLRYLDENNALRRQHARLYDQELAAAQGLTRPVSLSEAEAVYHLYVVRHSRREALREKLKEAGIGTDVHYPKALHHHAAFAGCRIAAGGLAVSEQAVGQVLSLPMYPHLTPEQIKAVGEAVRGAISAM